MNEILIVDDGSSDDIESSVENIQRTTQIPIRLVRQQNQGPSSARNTGVRIAKSQYVWFLDSDDKLLPSAVFHFSAAIAEHPDADMIFGSRITVLPSNRKRLSKAKPLSSSRVQNFEDEILSNRPTVGIGAAIIKREFALRHPFPEHFRICEDLVFFSTAFLKGNCIAIDPAIIEIDQSTHHNFRNPDLLFTEHQLAYNHAISQLSNSPRKLLLQKKLAAYPALRTFRELHRSGLNALAKPYYMVAMCADPLTALKISHLRKFLRCLFGLRHRASTISSQK